METYLVLRRGAWRNVGEAEAARTRAAAEAERLSELVEWRWTCTFAECDGTFGSVCVYEAVSPEALRHHAATAVLPVDEIVKVVDNVVVRPDPAAAAA
jgi:Nickel responsive protein SCO4226-like